MKSIHFLVIFILCALQGQSQEVAEAKNTIYIEAFGNGFFYTLNYDRLIVQFGKDFKFAAGARIGIGGTYPYEDYLGDDDIYLAKWVVPVEAYFLWGKKAGKLDIGLGFGPGSRITSYNFTREYKTDYFINFGYRYQRPDGGFFFKTGLLIQHFQVYGLGGPLPFFKLGLGYTF